MPRLMHLLSPFPAGSQTLFTLAAMNLIGFLRERGHQVTVLCPGREKADHPGYAVSKKPPEKFGRFHDRLLCAR